MTSETYRKNGFPMILSGAVALAAVSSAWAVEVVWQGPTSGSAEWTATENWVGGVMPGKEDCAVFGEDIGTLTIVNTTTSAKTLYFKDITVKSGTITFARSANTTYYLNNATNLFTISPGAKVIWECASEITANNVISIHVAGGGTWQGPKYGGARFGTTGWGGRYLREVRAKEGSTVTFPGYGSYINRYVAEKDATLTIGAISSLHGFEIFEAERGGTINISNGNGNNSVGALRGEGTINFTNTGFDYPVQNASGPNTFGGVLNHSGSGTTKLSSTVDEIKNRLVVCSSNAFANVSTLRPQETRLDFASGIGTFYFGKLVATNSNPIVTQDVDGAPIELHTKGIGGDTFLIGPGSWYNTTATTITGRQIRVAGTVTSTAELTFGADASFVGNVLKLPGQVSIAAGGTWILSGAGTDVYASQETGLNQYRDTLLTTPLKQGVRVSSAGAGASIVVESNAVLRLTSANDSKMPSFTLRDGGTLYLMRRDYGWASSGNEDTYTLDADGGVIELGNYSMAYYSIPLSSADAAAWTCRIGAGGLTFRARGVQAMTGTYAVDWYVPGKSAVTEGKDGGIILDGAGTLAIKKPQDLTGPMTVRDGQISIAGAAVTESSGVPLGTGDIVFENGQLSSPSGYDGTRQFATGSGSAVRLRGAGRLSATNDVLFGAVERTRGGVLFVDAASLDGATTRIRVTDGVSTDAAGRTHDPIVYDKNQTDLHFMKCDATKGFIPFVEGDYTAGLDGGVDSVALVKQSTKVSVPADTTKQVAALRIQKDTTVSADASIALGTGAKLKVGDGTHPGVVLLVGNGGLNGHAFNAVTGSGALDFGTSEGVVLMPKRSNQVYSPVPTISARISGANGVTFAGVPSADNASINALLTLSGDNDFTGGAIVENTMVSAVSATAFGANVATVRGGHWHGATVDFPTANTTYANDFVLRGNGYFMINRVTASDTAFAGTACGALHFGASGVKLTGNVAIDDYARISSMFNFAGAAAEISGVISGGKLQVVSSSDIPIALAGANTYTGGTEIVSSTVILRGANPSFGTGDILIDDGTLRFENTATLTITNRVEGVGTFVLAGEPEVKFAGDCSELTATLELVAGRHTFTSMPPFKTLVAPASGRTTLVFPANLGTVAWDGAELSGAADSFLLDIGEGTVLDLGGKTLTVRRALNGGAKRVVNGTISETHPQRGTLIMIR